MSATPYYHDGQVTIYHGDCLEITEWLTADALVTDPPYGTQFSPANPAGGYGRRRAHIANDSTTEARDAVLDLWGAERPRLVFASPRLPEPPGQWADRLVWDKTRPGMNGGPWRYQHESIFASEGFVRRDNSSMSVLRVWPDQTDHIHAKPVALMMALVRLTPDAAVIADPFAGSGSTLVAARNLGRRAIGVELEERYCEVAARRLDQQALDFGAES